MYYSEKDKIEGIIRYLSYRKERNKAIIERAENALIKNSSIGSLNVLTSNNQTMLYHNINGRRTYIKSGDPIIKALADSDYNKELIRKANMENAWIRRTIKSMPELVEDIYINKQERRNLVAMQFMTDEELVEAWFNKENPGNPRYPENKIHETDNGEMVRSKSERDIANTYKRLGIPYRYEYPVQLKGYGLVHPDFMMFSVSRKKEYFHEHLGRMDEPAYVADAIARIQAYERNGIVEGDRLIITFEDKEHPFSIKDFEHKIRSILLSD